MKHLKIGLATRFEVEGKCTPMKLRLALLFDEASE